MKADLEVVKGNINLTNELIDAADPSANVNLNDVLVEMVSTLRGMEEKMYSLISAMDDEGMMNLTLLINDDLNKTLARFKKLEKGQQPEAFVPSEAHGNQELNPTHIYQT